MAVVEARVSRLLLRQSALEDQVSGEAVAVDVAVVTLLFQRQ
jgi:hypothetical protein